MTVSSVTTSPLPAPNSSNIARPEASVPSSVHTLSQTQTNIRNELFDLRETVQNEVLSDFTRGISPTQSLLGVIENEFASDDLSDAGVAYLLDLANRQLNTNRPFTVSADGLSGGRFSSGAASTPATLAEVLGLAADTQALLRAETRSSPAVALSTPPAASQNGLFA